MGRAADIGLALLVGLAAAAHGGEIEVAVDNPPGTGMVLALLYDVPDAFADLRDPRATLELPDGGRTAARFGDLAPGRYAVVVFHDVNGNGRLDENFMGIPREPLGFSNRYWAKGPPAFAGAALEVDAGALVPAAVDLKKIFGRKGLIGVGAGVLAQTSPYRDSGSMQAQAIPAITYIGERFQILGPLAQAGLVDFGPARLAATARYRLGAYEEDDSAYLDGMGDRQDSLFCGLALQAPFVTGLRTSAGYEHDVLDRVGGGFGRLGVRRGFQFGRWSLAPNFGLNWMSAELARHEYGVEPAEARADRPAYRPGDAVNLEPGLGVSAEWRGAWRLVANGSLEFLAAELRASPLVDESAVFHFFGAVNYTF